MALGRAAGIPLDAAAHVVSLRSAGATAIMRRAPSRACSFQAQTALLTARARDPRNIPWRALIRRGKIEEPRQNETVGIAVVVEGRDDDRS